MLRPSGLAGCTLIFVLAVGCGGERHAPIRPAAQPSAVQPSAVQPSAVQPSAVQPSVAKPAAGPPAPVVVARSRQKGFLADLKAIDRGLAADRAAALSRALDICFRVYDGNPDDAVRSYAQAAFGSGTVKVSAGHAGEIVAKVKKWICSDAAVYRRWES